jgi:hypothetical protein
VFALVTMLFVIVLPLVFFLSSSDAEGPVEIAID